MIYLEMSRDAVHGGGRWSFSKCLWAPAAKKGGGSWPFWELVQIVEAGDTVLHLRGKRPKAYFVGFSKVASAGIETEERPLVPGPWAYAKSFYRAELCEFIPFSESISLDSIFAEQELGLGSYYLRNRARKADRRSIFFVRQNGRLQCLNGAYLSEVDAELFTVLFGEEAEGEAVRESSRSLSIHTDDQLRIVQGRLGHQEFAKRTKERFLNLCCFPGCDIDDPAFLVGAHIARWSDSKTLRGELGNGLCLCAFHDKAFELGLFTLDSQFGVAIAPRTLERNSVIRERLAPFAGMRIRDSHPSPLAAALQAHWLRVGFTPSDSGSWNEESGSYSGNSSI